MGAVAAIRTSGLTKRYDETVALDGLDLAVEPGEVYGYLGPNGAGKTTTIRLLLGLLRPTGGRAELFGVGNRRLPEAEQGVAATAAATSTGWPSSRTSSSTCAISA